ncbi:HTH domain-containing protein [Acetobacter thailandicus]|uniref:HTH domain-containing protein n=1 Tax=Acetobacter thailandicus TaxID=1502842 RepID=UPI001FD05B33|nr:HTH domain-containing protein [Acetobacter thailandicus]
MSNLFKAIRNVLLASNTPLSAKAIVARLNSDEATRIGGITPWKTVGARLSVDIRSNPNTLFMRVGPGMYALKAWTDLVPVTVKPRQINPVDEDILVLGRDTIEQMKEGRKAGRLFDIDYRDLLKASYPINRMKAEDNEELVQLIPSFIISMDDQILSFKRTRKTPEQRLHDSYSIVFGGHLQSEDNPSLFVELHDQLEQFLFRELYEELTFEPPFLYSQYRGLLHLEETAFERQHAGIVFSIQLQSGTKVTSLEPGFHSGLQFLPWDSIEKSPVIEDRWSAACIMHMLEV